MNRILDFDRAVVGHKVFLGAIKNNIDIFLKDAIQGGLKENRKGTKRYFYHRFKNEAGENIERYLNKKNQAVISDLAQKKYYEHVEKLLDKHLNSIMTLDGNLNRKLDEVYYDMPVELRKFVDPIVEPVEETLRQWNEEENIKYIEHADSLRFHTLRGEIVRSKSEVIIADALYRNNEQLDYKYERRLILKSNGSEVIVHPDFTVLNKNRGNIVYWEHAGKMDDPKYVRQFMWKINLYVANNLRIGKDVFFTFENYDYPLDLWQIEQTLNQILIDIW